MTTSAPGAHWDDERLAAAFAARAALAVTPVDLASSANAAVRARPRSEVVWRRLLIPAAAMILAVGAVSGGIALLGAQQGSSGPSQPIHGPSANPSASPSPVDPWAGREAMGLPVISVTDAIAIRDAGIDDREIAVHGWFWPVAPIPCPLMIWTSRVQPVCLDQFVVLMANPESLGTGGSSGYRGNRPTGPSFQIDLDDLDAGWQPALPASGPSEPVEIAVVGHFDDRGSTSCPAEQQNACRDRFVVDRVDSVNGARQPTSVVDYVEGGGKPFDEAQAVIDVLRPGVTVLSAAHGIGGFDPPRIEPTFVYHSLDLKQEAMWIVRVLDRGALATYVFIDSTADLYDITRDSTSPPAIAPSESAPGPTPAWGPWPPQDALSVMEFKDDLGRKAFVAVVDGSGMLEWVQVGVPDPAIGGSVIGVGGLVRDPSGVHRYRLQWTTTICDREMIVTIEREAARIVIEHAPREGCDTMPVLRDLVLQFTRDPAFVEVGIVPPTLLPEPPPEPTTTVVKLEGGQSTESVLVIDHAATLMEARAATSVPTIADFAGVRLVRADDGGTIVIWTGTLCDRDLWISVEADDVGPPDRIVVHGTRVEPCRLALIRRAIWLDLGPVDVASIGAQMAVAVPSDGQSDAGPLIGVADALVVRSDPGDDHQLQVRGWYWHDAAIYDCFVPPSPPPALEAGCHGPHDRLVADPEDPTGPGFVVWLRPGVEAPQLRFGAPSEFVVVGHFDDALAKACPTSTRDSCRDVFVVEEVRSASAR